MSIGSFVLDIPVPESAEERAAFQNNLLVGGLFVPVTKPLQLRTRLRVRVIGAGQPVELVAEVVHYGGGFAGLQIIGFNQADRIAIEVLFQGAAEPAPPPPEPLVDDEMVDDDLIDDEMVDDERVDDERVDDELIDDEAPAPSLWSATDLSAAPPDDAPATGLFDDAFSAEFSAPQPVPPPPMQAAPVQAAPVQAAPMQAAPMQAAPPPRPTAPTAPPRPATPSTGPRTPPPSGTPKLIESDLPGQIDRWAREQGDKPPPKGLPPNTVAAHILEHTSHSQGMELAFTDPKGVVTRIVVGRERIVSVSREPRPASETNVADILRKDGEIENQHYSAAIEEHKRTQRPLELLLREHVEPRALGMALRTLLKRDLALCFSSPRLELRTGPANMRDIIPLPLEVRRTVFNGLRDAAATYPTEQLIKGMRGFGRYFVGRADPLPMPINDLDLHDTDLRFWETTLGRPVAMRQVFAVSALSQTASLRMLYALRILGMIQFLSDWVPEVGEILKPYRAQLEGLERDDPYGVLELHWTGLREDVEAAHKRMTERWTSIRVPEIARDEMERLRERALARIGTAYRFLVDDNRRRAHRDKKIDEGQRMGSAQLSHDQARMALFSKDYREARRLAAVAVDLNPSEAEFRQFLAKLPQT